MKKNGWLYAVGGILLLSLEVVLRKSWGFCDAPPSIESKKIRIHICTKPGPHEVRKTRKI